MSVYYRETPTGEIVEMPFALARDLSEVPASVWAVSCACSEEGPCPECAASALSETKPEPSRLLRWLRLGRKEPVA
jgi:hypothetical protein